MIVVDLEELLRSPCNHAVWHVCVMAGSLCHDLSILWYIVPVAPD